MLNILRRIVQDVVDAPSFDHAINGLVEGVQSANAVLETRTCNVTFDDAIASVDDILGATADIGYKSSVMDTGGS